MYCSFSELKNKSLDKDYWSKRKNSVENIVLCIIFIVQINNYFLLQTLELYLFKLHLYGWKYNFFVYIYLGTNCPKYKKKSVWFLMGP